MNSFETDTGNEDGRVAELTQGLQTKQEFKQIIKGMEMQKHALDEEPVPEQPTKKRKKKKKGAAGAMSFDLGEGEGEEEVAPKKKIANPNLNASFLKKKEWMSADEKIELKKKEHEDMLKVMQQREEEGAKPLTIVFSFTMRPVGGKGEVFHNNATDPDGEHVVVNEKPPRVFKTRTLVTTWGTKIEDACAQARTELQAWLTAKGEVGVANLASQNLMMTDGHMILPEGKSFLDLHGSSYEDGTPIFHFGTTKSKRMGGDASHRAEALFNICERHWYEDSKFHFPQSQWQLFNLNKTYPNPNKSNRKTTAEEEDEPKKVNIDWYGSWKSERKDRSQLGKQVPDRPAV